MNKQKTIVISLGGSIICPSTNKINTAFLKKFRALILSFIKRGYKFVIISGGGKIARLYQKSANKITKVSPENQDWIGISATKLNACLLRAIFADKACPVIFDSPHKKVKKYLLEKPVIIASGWKPGFSTDYDAVLLAKRFKLKEVINAGNISFVYDKDPKKYKNAHAFKKINWADYQKIISSKWIPGLSTPFDPVATKMAKKLKMRAIIILGTDIKNFEKVLQGDNFKGTIIE
jgi:uridylate kinase